MENYEKVALDLKEYYGRLAADLKDIDKRISRVENTIIVQHDEIISLRASRHEYGGWLNRHNLEINELLLKGNSMAASLEGLASKVDKLDTDFKQFQLTFLQQMSTLKSDLRQTMWVVAVITGVLVFFGRMIASKFGF